MRSQFIYRRTRSERAVVVEISERWFAVPSDAKPIKKIRASGPLHEHRRRRCPGVLEIVKLAVLLAHNNVHVAIGVEVSEHGGAVAANVEAVEGIRSPGPRHEIRRRRRPRVLEVEERAGVIARYKVHVAVVVEIHERGRGKREPSAVRADDDALEGPVRRHLQEPLRVARADGCIEKTAVRRRVGCVRVRVRRLQRAAVLARKSCAVHRDQQRRGEAPGSPGAAFSLGAAHRHRRVGVRAELFSLFVCAGCPLPAV